MEHVADGDNALSTVGALAVPVDPAELVDFQAVEGKD